MYNSVIKFIYLYLLCIRIVMLWPWQIIQRSKKWLVHGLVKFATAVARLVCPDLLG